MDLNSNGAYRKYYIARGVAIGVGFLWIETVASFVLNPYIGIAILDLLLPMTKALGLNGIFCMSTLHDISTQYVFGRSDTINILGMDVLFVVYALLGGLVGFILWWYLKNSVHTDDSGIKKVSLHVKLFIALTALLLVFISSMAVKSDNQDAYCAAYNKTLNN